MTRVLMVVSAATYWTLADGTRYPTGFWGEELAVPHRLFTRAGWQVSLATPGGVPPTLNRLSMGFAGGLPSRRQTIRAYLTSIGSQLRSPLTLENVDADAYDVVFYPGGTNAFAGRRMTGLSNAEERLNPFAWKAKWLLEDRLGEAGVRYGAGFPLRPHLVTDRHLYTGQNPQSSQVLAMRIIHDRRSSR